MGWESFRRDHGDGLVDQGFDRIGETVHRRRQRLGLTQQHLASLSGIDQSVISRLERGQLRGLRWSRFAKIVGALGGLDESAPIPPWCLGNIGLIGARQRSEPRPSSIADEPRPSSIADEPRSFSDADEPRSFSDADEPPDAGV